MSITRYTAADVQTSANGNLVAYEDWLYEHTARMEAFKGRVEAQRLYQDALEQIWSLQRDVEELEERLRSK